MCLLSSFKVLHLLKKQEHFLIEQNTVADIPSLPLEDVSGAKEHVATDGM